MAIVTLVRFVYEGEIRFARGACKYLSKILLHRFGRYFGFQQRGKLFQRDDQGLAVGFG